MQNTNFAKAAQKGKTLQMTSSRIILVNLYWHAIASRLFEYLCIPPAQKNKSCILKPKLWQGQLILQTYHQKHRKVHEIT